MEQEMNTSEMIINKTEILKLLLRIDAGKIDVKTEIENIKAELAMIGVNTENIKA